MRAGSTGADSPSTGSPSADFGGRGLFIPALQPGPFPVEAVEPSPCTLACPAGINVKSYVSLIAEGRFTEALEVVRERCPLPGICGRICHHPCETVCKRREVDEPVAIRALKRFVADIELELPPPAPPPAPDNSERIAVIGSGPAGLTAAYDLCRAGYPVTVFESEPEPGGMLRYGIADYRLPTDVLDAEIAVLTDAGIEIETGCTIGTDLELEVLLAAGYSAALLAVGVQKGSRLGLEGEDDCGEVEDALAFLRRVNHGDRTPIEGKVLVIGGGSTAIEAARAALRLGAAEVEIVYRRDRGQMPADNEEIDVAEAEGITFRLLSAPSRIVTLDGEFRALECLQVGLGEPDPSGRRRPVLIPGSEFSVEAGRVFVAVGQEADFGFLPDEVVGRVAERGRVRVDRETAMTPMRGIFAAGDVVTGPTSVIDAIASGHEAATAIRCFLEQGEPEEGPSAGTGTHTEYEIPSRPPARSPRLRPPHAEITPGDEFVEAELAFSPADAVAEAKRCMRCGPCSECLICASSCGRRHITMRPAGADPSHPATVLRAPAAIVAGLVDRGPSWLVPRIGRQGSETHDPGSDLAVELAPNRVHIDEEHCRGCARCIEVCTFGAIRLVDPEAPETAARVEAALCRGCNLCAAVCPTDAAIPLAVAAGWWGDRLPDLYPLLAAASQPPLVVLACRRRVDRLRDELSRPGLDGFDTQLIPLHCAGQIDAGEILEIYRNGAGRILIAGCLSGSCHYRWGPQMAAEQVLRVQSTLEQLGIDPHHVAADWAGDKEEEALDHRALDLIIGRDRATDCSAIEGRGS